MNSQLSLDYSIINVEVSGKITSVTIEDNTTGEIFTGWAACNPKDKFQLPLGVALAERRAVRKMALTSIDDDIHDLAC